MTTKLLGNLSKGLIFVVSAPAGTGKSTLVAMLTQEFSCIAESCSCTTRKPRIAEIPDRDYHFVSHKEFEEKVKAGAFLEYAEVFGNFYGTLKAEVETLQLQGKHVILVIDTQGATQLKQHLSAIFIFISPPSLEVLSRRLTQRKTESPSKINERLQWAQHEIEMSENYDYHIINDDLLIAYQVLKSILISEEHKIRSKAT